jgi:hypothetical protein
MSTNYTKISGSSIRQKLRTLGLPGGTERVCCGGRVSFSRDYESQLRALKMKGSFKIMENGAVVEVVTID